ncbi:MAG TPA: hypothetical protein VJR89_30530, partial [Polyangiales bacterium]|nr:hypothetical protein [Polyangiales bacterium]
MQQHRFGLASRAWLGTLSAVALAAALLAPHAGAQDKPAAAPAPLPAAPPPPVAPPSPFVFTLKGTVAATFFAQDKPFASGNGVSALFSPFNVTNDAWMLGADVRHTRLTFTLRGPEVLSAIPTAVLELELFGGNQINSVPASTVTGTVSSSMTNMPIGTFSVPGITSSPQGDESLLPRMRTAYIELNWNGGADILRVGQFHNLLLAMISASSAHPGVLGYGAGQLGWRSPGITYLHKFLLNEDTAIDAGLQLNRNSWLDNAPTCGPMGTPPQVNCLPYGVSLGEASMLPQVQARLVLSGGRAESPWPYYAPNVWQVYVVGHWDLKDLSGVGNESFMARDTMTTLVLEGGFKLKLGPVLIAGNAWTGTNGGNVYANLLQMQLPDKPDVSGFGVWGQLG